MANLKSSKKDIRRIAKRRVRNQSVRTALKTYIKRAIKTAEAGEKDASSKAVVTAVKYIDKAVKKGVIHKNQAARRKSRMARTANKALAAKA
ncbi:MAG: 30S ribosomal protein S20 [Fimbriimonadaceae bacterium]|nr:30S ribosomal protein S20 [Fimbriimonadaceae bacterium]QYK55470.1 MAG: 30S ribosomal protein S20 [Fimbriimonadaceae bacterium]